MAVNKRIKLQQNIEAIKIVLDEREINPEDKLKLKLFSGFGGLKCVIYDPDKPSLFPKGEENLIPLVKELHDLLRTNSKNENEYKSYFNSLKQSVLTSFYTPIELVNQLSDKLFRAGLTFDNLLDPSAGNGVFLNIDSKRKTAIEKDLLTGKILKAQYPEVNVEIKGFEDISRIVEKSFDIVTSNIPFGDFYVFDPIYINSKSREKRNSCKSIHNYFFLKSVDMLRDGGIIAFITSTGLMDSKQGENFRRFLLRENNLISAIRLPQGTFSDVDVMSDFIILQKNLNRSSFNKIEKLFLSTTKFEDVELNGLFAQEKWGNAIIYNKDKFDTDPYGKPKHIFYHNDIKEISTIYGEYLSRDIYKNFNLELYNSFQKESYEADVSKPIQLSLFSEFVASVKKEAFGQKKYFEVKTDLSIGSVLYDSNYIGILQEDSKAEIFKNISVKEQALLKSYCDLRDIYFQLKDFEINNQKENVILREELNSKYDLLVETFGTFKENNKILFNDINFKEIQGLEIVKDGVLTKADIFFEPVVFVSEKEIYEVEEAYSKSLNKLNKVDIEMIMTLSGKSKGEVLLELDGKIFFNPITSIYEPSYEFLSGNVVKKAEDIYRILQNNPNDGEIIKSYKALFNAIPEKIPFYEIGLNLGERWIPEQLYSEFASQIFQTNAKVIYLDGIDAFTVSIPVGDSYYANSNYRVKASSRNYDASKTLEIALQDEIPKMTKNIINDEGETIKVVDSESIQKMNECVDRIKAEFADYLLKLPQKTRDYIEDLYNRKFNCFVKPHYDGSFQTFPDLNLKALGIENLYSSQKDAILMLKNNNGGIIDHEVGGGKTLIMCVAAYEKRRLGISNKPMIIGLNANIEQIANTFKTAYPNAKLLYPSEVDFSKSKREELFNKIQNNNWDCIILSHEQFARIPQSPEVQKMLIEEELEKLEEVMNSIDYFEDPQKARREEKRLLKEKERIQVVLQSLIFQINNKSQSNVVDFKTMGIDDLSVDESHQYKNLRFKTRHSRVAGIGNSTGSERAFNLLVAIRTIQGRSNKDLGATFASGTTISNSLTELYNLFVYLRPNALKEQGLSSFDSWAATYTIKSKEFEFSVTNEIIQKERFRYFIKVPELSAFYSQITDFRTADSIGVDRPEINEHLVLCEPTEIQLNMFDRLKDFARTGDGSLIFRKPLTESEDRARMLITTNTAKLASLDMRLISADFPEEEAGKLSIVAQNTFRIYHKFDYCKGTQFIFCDTGTYKPDEFNLYTALKELLVEKGIPADEVQFIHSFETRKKRREAFDKMNQGVIRVMIGSTSKLGTGVNAQERAVSGHNVDIPWRPSDLQQRHGRLGRAGNRIAKTENGNKVEIFIYATKQSLDTYKFNLLKCKEDFIRQIKSNTATVRQIDEGAMDESTGIGFAEYVALTSGNTDLLEKAKLERKIAQLKSEEKLFLKRFSDAEREKFVLIDKVKEHEQMISRLLSDKQKFEDIPRDEEGNILFKVNLKENVYTNFKDLGIELNRIFEEENRDNVNYIQIGNFYNFCLMIKSDQTLVNMGTNMFENKLYIKGEFFYSHNNGFLPRTAELAGESVIKALLKIPVLIEKYEKSIKEQNEKIEALDCILSSGRIFNKKEELVISEKEYKILNERLESSLSLNSDRQIDTRDFSRGFN